MGSSSSETKNQERYVSNQETSLMAIQQQVIRFDNFLEKHFNIYGLLKLKLTGKDAKPYHLRLFYLFKFACIVVA